jgi:DNA-binding response OmpR family regulator
MGEMQRPAQILIVEDDYFISDLLVDDLTERGYAVQVATNARMLGRLMETYPPDLILLDIMLPGMDGGEIGHLLRVNPATATIPVLVVSADRRAAQKAASFRAEGYVAKPFDLDSLAAQIAELLARHPRLRVP